MPCRQAERFRMPAGRGGGGRTSVAGNRRVRRRKEQTRNRSRLFRAGYKPTNGSR